nr:DUF4364 family protein [bacterium]
MPAQNMNMARLLVLYAMTLLPEPIEEPVLDSVVVGDDRLDWFSYKQVLAELIELGLAGFTRPGTLRVTQQGHDTLRQLMDELPPVACQRIADRAGRAIPKPRDVPDSGASALFVPDEWGCMCHLQYWEGGRRAAALSIAMPDERSAFDLMQAWVDNAPLGVAHVREAILKFLSSPR